MGQPGQQVLTASEKARTKWTRDKIISFRNLPKKDL